MLLKMKRVAEFFNFFLEGELLIETKNREAEFELLLC